MGFPIPTTEMPERLVVGDYWQWYFPAISNYPAASWALTFGLAGPAGIQGANGVGGWTIAAQANGSWLVQVAKANTAGYTAGRYSWAAYVTNGSERYEVADGYLTLEPNTALASGDQRTHAQKMVAYITAALEARANGDIFAESVSIGGRSISKMTTAQLRQLLGQYRAEVDKELALVQGGMQNLGINFVRPSS